MPDDLLSDLFDPSPSEKSATFSDSKLRPADRVHSIAKKAGISPDVADDYLRTTQIESGHNINVRNSSKGAIGFGQVMPDVKGGTVRTVGGRSFNLKDPDQNIEAGLRYFAEGGSDPVARRLYYFGGPRAKQHYERTGKIPNISDSNMTAAQYVQATGGQKAQPKPSPDLTDLMDADPLGDLFDKNSGQTPQPKSEPSATNPPRAPSVPIDQALAKVTQQTNRIMRRRGIRTEPIPESFQGAGAGSPQIIDAGNAEPVDLPEQIRARITGEMRSTAMRQRGGGVMPKPEEIEQQVQAELTRRYQAQEEQARILKQFTPDDWAEIKDFSDHLQGKGRVYTGVRTGIRAGGSSGLYKLAGLFELANKIQQPITGQSSWIPDYLRKKALAGEMSVDDIPVEKRNQLAEFLAQSGVGLAEVMATPGGPISKFAGLGAAEAVGRNQPAPDVAKAATTGALTGALFRGAEELAPEGAGALRRASRTVPAVAAGTGAIELAGGASPRQAGISALSNAAFQGVGEIGRGRRARQIEAQPNVAAQPEPTQRQPTQAVSEAAAPISDQGNGRLVQPRTPDNQVSEQPVESPPDDVVAESVRQTEAARDRAREQGVRESVSDLGAVPQRFYHKDWGEVEILDDQSGARRGKVKVAEVADPTKLHYPKRSDLSGAGNQRMVPLKPEDVSAQPEPTADLSPAEAAKERFKLPLITDEELSVGRTQRQLTRPFDVTYESESGKEITRKTTIGKRLKMLSKKQDVLNRLVDCLHG